MEVENDCMLRQKVELRVLLIPPSWSVNCWLINEGKSDSDALPVSAVTWHEKTFSRYDVPMGRICHVVHLCVKCLWSGCN